MNSGVLTVGTPGSNPSPEQKKKQVHSKELSLSETLVFQSQFPPGSSGTSFWITSFHSYSRSFDASFPCRNDSLSSTVRSSRFSL